MVRYAVLLRGVNVGGKSKLPMSDLRKVLESLGHTDVTTYLQSGNAVITSDDDDPERTSRRIEEALATELGMTTRILVRTGPELAAVIADNPFPKAVAKPALLHIAFLPAQPDPDTAAKIDPGICPPDEFRVGDRAVYLRYEFGSGRSKLADLVLTPLLRGRPDMFATARNWNTVLKLADKTAQ